MHSVISLIKNPEETELFSLELLHSSWLQTLCQSRSSVWLRNVDEKLPGTLFFDVAHVTLFLFTSNVELLNTSPRTMG